MSEPEKTLVLAIINQALRDSRGKAVKRHSIIKDGYKFFFDGRYQYWCDLIGITPITPPLVGVHCYFRGTE